MNMTFASKASVVATVLCLASALLAPTAHAQHENVQRLSVGGADGLVGIDSAGRVTAVWVDQPSRGAIRYAVRPPGSSFGFVRSIRGVADPVSELAFAESSNGRAVVVWTEFGILKAAVRTGPLSDFGPARVIGGGGTAATGADFLDVAVSDSGRAVISWVADHDGDVHAVLASGGVFGLDVTLEQGNGDLEDPAVGIDLTGRALVVWEDRGSTTTTLVRGAAAPAGGGFGAPTTLDILTGQSFRSNPELAVNADGDALLAYISGHTVVARMGSVSGAMGEPQPIAGPPNGSATNQQVALDPSGSGAVVLSLTNAGESPLMGAVSNAAGTFGALQTVSAGSSIDGPAVGEEALEVAAGGGEFSVYFANDHDADEVSKEPYLSTTVNGVFGAPHRLSPNDPDAESNIDVHGARSNGRTAGIWSRWDGARYVVQATPVVPDTTAPRARSVTASPNPYQAGSGRLRITFNPSEEVRASVLITNNGAVVAKPMTGVLLRAGQTATALWNGRRAGRLVAAGLYRYEIRLVDAAGNRGAAGGSVRVTR